MTSVEDRLSIQAAKDARSPIAALMIEAAETIVALRDGCGRVEGRSYEKSDEKAVYSNMIRGELDWPTNVVSRLRTFAADKRIEQLPAKFRWTMVAAADEIDRLRLAIRLLAEEDDTLTQQEREAVTWAADHLDNCGWSSATLRGLLERPSQAGDRNAASR